MNPQITARGTLYTTRIGDLQVTYLSGRDADELTPVYDMSVGEVVVKNLGARPINLQYDSSQTFFSGHKFAFGPKALEKLQPPPSPSTAKASFINFDLQPGQQIFLARQDLMDRLHEVGPAALDDGTMCTRFVAAVLVDSQPQSLVFGPHCFHIAPKRDWDAEQAAYVQFFLARDKAAMGG